MTRCSWWMTLAAVGVMPSVTVADRIEITSDPAGAVQFYTGRVTTFTVKVTDDAGKLVRSGTAKTTLDNFGDKTYGTRTFDLAAANPFRLKGTMDEPGVLRLSVSSGTNNACWGVAYQTRGIVQAEPCPEDFDAYWSAEKARLEKEVPLDAKCELDPKRARANCDCYNVSFATFNGKRVYGFLAVPKGMKPGERLPLHVNVPGAGPWALSAATRPGEITLVMNVHAYPPPYDAKEMKRMMSEQNAALAKKYGLPDPTSYCSLAGIGESREDYWYHDIMLGINRAVDWACARPDVDVSRVTYSGGSQGGGFGLFLTYLNGHFTRSLVCVPAITGHYGYKQGRQSGWPNLIARQRPEKRAAAERNAAYFDGVNFARKIRKPIRFVAGLCDRTCPPANVWAAFNACPSENKDIVGVVGAPHSWQKGVDGAAISRELEDWLRRREDTVVAPVPGRGTESRLPSGRAFRLAWSDEFDGNALDETVWSYRTNFWGRPAHWFAHPKDRTVEVKDGHLHLRVAKRADGQFVSPQLQTGEILWDCPDNGNTNGFWWISKRDRAKMEHRYGYWECRCKLQRKPGWWSAFWMQSANIGTTLDAADSGAEIDMMECFKPGVIAPHNVFMRGYGDDLVRYEAGGGWNRRIPDPDGWHVWGVLWDETGYTFYFDGVEDGRVRDCVSHRPHFLLLTTECRFFRKNRMTGTADPQLEEAVKANDEFIVDYVRIWDEVK